MKRAIPLLLLLFFAALILSAAAPPYLERCILIDVDGEGAENVRLKIDFSHALRAEGHGGYCKLYDELLEEYDAKDALNYLAVGLGDYLSAICERHRVDPLDATLEWTKKLSSPFLYYAERPGRQTDLAEMGREVARALDQNKDACAHARTHEVSPAVTEDDLRAMTREIARFSTDFRTSGEARRHNLTLAAQAANGVVLAPGESFSFNDTVGERSEARGYRIANIVVNGAFVKGVGGGVCQVSTTLYNAVLLAGLPVENAAAHSCPVSYVPCSRDCTVSSAIDFRFRNDTDHPLYIASEVRGNTLTFALFGEKIEETGELESEIVETLPYCRRYEDGTPLRDGEEATLLSPGREGIRSRLYRVNGDNRTLLRENLYPAKDEIYRKNEWEKA